MPAVVTAVAHHLPPRVLGNAELAARLGALYDYMCARLLFANLHNNEAALREVAGLLQEIKGAWEEIARDPAVLSGTPAAA